MNGNPTLRAPRAARCRRRIAAALLPLATALPLSTLLLGCATEESSARSTSESSTSLPPTTAAPERLDVVASDYEWSDLPDRLAAGSYPLTLRNTGPDVHEIQVFKNTANLSLNELYELGPVGFKEHVELAGGAIVGPGATSAETVLHLEKGTYEVVCFVPATTDQRPHFDHGMHQSLTVY